MTKKYLISLHGGGDSYYMIVGQAAWDWIDSPRPDFGKDHAVDEVIPAGVLAEATALGGFKDTTCRVTTGSCENDRALLLTSIYFTEYQHPKRLEVEDTYEGCIY